MIIIADCGGTKSDWALVCDDRTVVRMQTGGINPIHQSEDDIVKQLDAVVQEVTRRRPAASTLDIYFYGDRKAGKRSRTRHEAAREAGL